MRDILCKIGIHSWLYKRLPYGGMRYFRKCKRCFKSQKKVNIGYEFRVKYITGELMQPKSKWRWMNIKMSIEDIRELKLRKLL